MKKETKNQLIEQGNLIGLKLSLKMTWQQLKDAVEAKKQEIEAKKDIKKDIPIESLIVVVNRVSNCGCSYVDPGTIAKLMRRNTGDRHPNNIKFCQNGCDVWVKDEDIRQLTDLEAAYAAERFSNAVSYRYARVD